LATCLIQLPKLCFGLGSVGIHALCDHLDFRPTLCRKALGGGAKLVSGVAPGLQLSVSLVLEDRLLLLDLLAEATTVSSERLSVICIAALARRVPASILI